jgi:hypothetical protein
MRALIGPEHKHSLQHTHRPYVPLQPKGVCELHFLVFVSYIHFLVFVNYIRFLVFVNYIHFLVFQMLTYSMHSFTAKRSFGDTRTRGRAA